MNRPRPLGGGSLSLAFPVRVRKNSGMDIFEEFIGVVNALKAAKIEFAVCGGFAMALHGLPRFTQDIDLLVRPDDLEPIVDVVKSCGFDVDSGIMQFGIDTNRQTEIRRVNKIFGKEYLTLDLLIVGPSLDDVWARKVDFTYRDQTVPAVSAAGLIKMKRIAGRPQDLADIDRLENKNNDPAALPD